MHYGFLYILGFTKVTKLVFYDFLLLDYNTQNKCLSPVLIITHLYPSPMAQLVEGDFMILSPAKGVQGGIALFCIQGQMNSDKFFIF